MSSVVVLGAGVNGLACALALARAGRKVLVLERRAEPGGLSARRAFGEGFSVPGVRHDTGEIRAGFLAELLRGQLALRASPASVFMSSATGAGLVLHAAPEAAREEIGRHSAQDAAAYAALRERLARWRTAIEPLLSRAPPPLIPRRAGEVLALGLTGLRVRKLGRADLVELLRVPPMCVADWMREQFATELLSATLALPAVLGDFVGPWSPGTAAMLVLRESLIGPGVDGGPAAVVDALVRALNASGASLRTSARVTRIRVEDGRARGVVLDTGEEVAADAIVAACSPRHALLDLLPPQALSVRDQAAARTIRSRGTAAKVHLGLREHPTWRARPGERFERVRIGAHLDDLERAFDAVKYRRLPARPVLDIAFGAGAVAGPQAASILVHAAPYDLASGWTAASRAALLESVLAVLEEHAPGVRAQVAASEVLAPPDIEAEYGATGGSIHHVERALDQLLFLRPARPFARYATPVEGLFLGSSGSHPGPGVTLAPGVLAARVVLGV